MEVVRNGDKQQKLNVDKLTSDFKLLVNMYSKLQIVIQKYPLFVLLIFFKLILVECNSLGCGEQNEVASVAECLTV